MIPPDAFPALNASLNAASGVLLLLGYASVRGRRLTLHKALMLTALAVSAIFLASYLYYHLAIKGGKPTRFRENTYGAPEWVAQVYGVLLLTHTTLAAVALPLALWTAYLGLTDRLARHVRVARWTFPMWLYVSVTGVVVYWMLYRLYPLP